MSVAVVSHDAGGAEVVSSYIARSGAKCNCCLAGPAVSIFERKLGPIDVVPLHLAISMSSWLLCGSSWQSDLEWQAIKLAREKGKQSVAFLDHWGNYRERFIRGKEISLPDQIWVGDVQAETLARQVFPEMEIILVGNPYIEDLRREIAAFSKRPDVGSKAELNMLVLCEPMREHGLKGFGNERHWGYTEEEALHYLFSNLHVFGRGIGRIVIRPHPSEPRHKYDLLRTHYRLPIIVGGGKTLLDEIMESDVVVGFQSMAMVVGLQAGRRVISCIPPGGKACSLPHSEIESLQEILLKLQ